eukprot:TRINITY_DN9876_c0_g1_i2.p2 TRINITY_DN9876_c0_g1~~TRINITY_DN9876_c0_g1_i2.p2  ORF type:complete len:218 (-),score=46.31 TRINITY_DN9876_c0_g1_i2:24-677(-)
MSKINPEVLEETIKEMLKYSLETKKRNFVETIELQIGLKNYDPSKDKRFAGSMALPNECRRKLTICVLGDQVDCDKAAAAGLPFMSVEDMKALKKDKKKVKELAGKYDSFLASESVIRRIPRLLGPGLNKAGKFPALIRGDEDLAAKLHEAKCTVKFQLKKVVCMSCPIGHVNQTPEEIAVNINLSLNFLVSMLKKGWQNIRSAHIKTTMGPPARLY